MMKILNNIIGAGLAVIAIIGPGIGIGLVFSSLFILYRLILLLISNIKIVILKYQLQYWEYVLMNLRLEVIYEMGDSPEYVCYSNRINIVKIKIKKIKLQLCMLRASNKQDL